MRLYIMVESNFKATTSGGAIFKGIKNILRKKRICYEVIDTLSSASANGEKTFLLLISTNISLIINAVAECEIKKIHPIIISFQLLNSIPGIYSSVTLNIDYSMRRIMKFLKSNGKTTPALYGISVNSAPDVARYKCFLQKHILPTGEEDVFYNHTGLDDCFEKFLAKREKYDCVICTNNYVAIHLVNRLRAMEYDTENLTVVSYGKILMMAKYYPDIIPVYVANETYGKAAITICEELKNNPEILHMNLSVKCCIEEGHNKFNETQLSDSGDESIDVAAASTFDAFYEDPHIKNMLLIERLLNSCDSTDSLILDSVINGASYEEIANNTFLSHSTVKYRVRRMMRSCNCESKSQFIDFMKENI